MKLTAEKKFQLLIEISSKVHDTLDLDNILSHLLDTLKMVMDYDAAGIFVLNQDLVHERHRVPREMIAGISKRGFAPGPPDRDEMLTHGAGIIGYVIRTCQSVVVPDVHLDERYVQGRIETQSEISVPVILNERAIGALNLESDHIAAYSPDDIEILRFFADAAAISIEKAMLHKQLMETELLKKQLDTAREVQFRLLPASAPAFPGYDIAGICLPAYEIGGDYFDYIPLSRNRLGLAIADVSGHGVPAALVMTAFRTLLRTKARGKMKPANIARALNRLLPEITADNHFVTLLYAILDVSSGTIGYTCCGHPPPLMLHHDGKVEILDQQNTALGIFQALQFTDAQLKMEQGDILCLYTDGVTELVNGQGEYFGIPRLVQLLQENAHLPSREIIQRVIQATRDFSESTGFLDDITLVIVHRQVQALATS
jgi:serine phosphatase RsbU (regulator of sigma subunit)